MGGIRSSGANVAALSGIASQRTARLTQWFYEKF
jgi:hypothetical protein